MSLFEVKDYWPKGVGYDTFEGYKSVEYPSSKYCTPESITHIIASWKYTAEQHNLSLPAAKQLNCAREGTDFFILTFLESATANEMKMLRGTIDSVEAEFDVNESPFEKETSISIKIKGFDMKEERPFDLYISINRYPKSAYVSFSS